MHSYHMDNVPFDKKCVDEFSEWVAFRYFDHANRHIHTHALVRFEIM